jgi:hypothetical protein
MMQWKALVLIDSIPTVIKTNAPNYVVAKGYFEIFGKVVGSITLYS